jgi:NADPH:quinone reductase-like Zn-dependent oxidoreductase
MGAMKAIGSFSALAVDDPDALQDIVVDVDEVWYAGDVTRPGTNAEFHAVDERIVSRKPSTLSFSEAAALPLTTITAWETLFERFRLNVDSTGTLLVLGAAGGVGSIMIQLAKVLSGVRVIGTASRPESHDWVRRLGADAVVDHNELQEQVSRVAPRASIICSHRIRRAVSRPSPRSCGRSDTSPRSTNRTASIFFR